MRIPLLDRSPAVAVVRLHGMIAAGPRGLSDAGLAPVLERAFRRGRPKAVALAVNSPGGSAVQSALIAARIRRLAEERKVPVLAFVEDLAASGGYWLASAADEIWVDACSIVGSIGVIYAAFGFHGLLERHGVERRVHTAGRSKSFLDPFSPEKKADVARLKALQEPIHAAFIAQVKARRGARLAEGEELFGGEVWTGARAVALGLADGVGHLVPEMRRRFGERVRFLEYGRRRPLLQRLGASLTDEVAGALEERALWARFGF
ncbi:MAG: S49 family peptidase [Rhodobacteraceae bacterium]|nr:S49 family peptidase [Paracoccaceae bacterium]